MCSVEVRTIVVAIISVLAVPVNQIGARQEDEPGVLDVGDRVPVFEGLDDQGAKWNSKDQMSGQYCVMLFFPGHYMDRRAKRIQCFWETMSSLAEHGVKVVAVSGDSVDTHQLFKRDYCVNATFLSDVDGSLAKKFDVEVCRGCKARAKDPDGSVILINGKSWIVERRVTITNCLFVIGPDGRIMHRTTKVDPVSVARQAQQVIDQFKKNANRN